MARKPTTINTTPAVNELDEGRLQEAETAARHLGALQAGYSQGRDTVNQLLGESRMAGAFEEFSRTVRISKLAQVKSSRAYKDLRGQISPHGAELSGTWEEFCQLLNKSVDQVDRDIANLQAFGEEALEQMQLAGIGYRDLRQFRKLGDDDKTLLIEAANSGDTKALIDVAEQMMAKHTAEKDSLEKALTSTKANLVAAEKVSKGHVEKINELTRQVVKFDVEIDLPAAFLDARQKATDAVNTILTELNRLEEIRDQAWDKLLPADEHGKGVHAGELSNLGLVMRGGFIAVNEKLEATLQAFNDTIDRVLAD